MLTLTVKKGETIYSLINLTHQNCYELENDPQKLTTYFNYCLQSGLNICIHENEGNSSSSTANLMENSNASCNASSSSASLNAHSTASGQRNRKFSFLCGRFERKNFIYAVKFEKHPWHYFDELDSISSQHGSLPAPMDSSISRLDSVKSIDVNLNEEQTRIYFDNGKFIFKNKELDTRMELANLGNKQSENQPSGSKSVPKSTKQLVFASGQTNPLLFLNEFEKCRDLKTDKDKMYKIRHFVDECHSAEFTKLYFTRDWPTVRSNFLKMYSLSFAENKKRELQIDFNESSTLRSFIERKLMNLAKFTTLPFINQVEMAMNDLPVEISSLFVTNEMMTGNKNEILDFCDSIQELVGTMRETTQTTEGPLAESNQPSNHLEIFDFNPELSEPSDGTSRSSRGGVRGRTRTVAARDGIRKRGRPPKKMKTILENGDSSSSYDFVNQMDETSRSSWSN